MEIYASSSSSQMGHQQAEHTLPFLIDVSVDQEHQLSPAPNVHSFGTQEPVFLPDVHSIVIGCLPTAGPLRTLQLNKAVTSPAESPYFQSHYLSKSKAAKKIEEEREMDGGALLYISMNTSVSQAVEIAVEIAVSIRTEQWFHKGNHRTALAALVFSLAEQGVILSSKYRAYHAYTILSARYHPGNESNSLNEVARADVKARMKFYLRTRARPIKQSQVSLDTHLQLADYLFHHVYAIQCLPASVDRIEARMNELQALADKGEWQERRRIWKSLDERERADLKLTYPCLNKGRRKLR